MSCTAAPHQGHEALLVDGMVDKWRELSNHYSQAVRGALGKAQGQGEGEAQGQGERRQGLRPRRPFGIGGGPVSRQRASGANDGQDGVASGPPSGVGPYALAEALLRLLSLVDSSQVIHTSPHTCIPTSSDHDHT